jgi:leucyl aminopeptidase
MTELEATTAPLPAMTGCVVVGVVRDRGRVVLAPGAAEVSECFGPALPAVLERFGASGDRGHVVRLPAPEGSSADLIVAVGLGEAPGGGRYDDEVLRRAAGEAVRSLAGTEAATLALPISSVEDVAAVGLGGLLGAYSFDTYRNREPGRTSLARLAVRVDRELYSEACLALRRAMVVAEEIHRCRDLVNTPANDLYPDSFAGLVREAGAEHGLAVDVLDEAALAQGSYGGLVGVGKGSACPPRLVRVGHTHPEATTTLAFVGKGITYDSGGISLKPVGFNEIMKRDMAGAAAVFAAVLAVARLGLRVDVVGWLALAENMPSGSATRPGDVLRMYDGSTVEVVNTDAEGRLVLADALARAAEDRPAAIVDVATLTAATRLGLGNYTFGVMANDDAFGHRIVDAAGRDGEQAWRMPLPADLRPSLSSTVADVANTGERMGGGLVAGLFLERFVPSGVPWAHLDIAGPAFHEGEPYGYTPHGGTGSAVRTLVNLAELAAAGKGSPA